MLFHRPVERLDLSKLQLNKLVDEASRSLRIDRLPRDLPKRDRTSIVRKYISMAKQSTIKLLPVEYWRQPYASHAALALYDSNMQTKQMVEHGQVLTMNTRFSDPFLSDHELRSLFEHFGVEDVRDTAKWISREQYGRSMCYATTSIHWREYFMKVLAEQRWALNSRFQPPTNYEIIAAGFLKLGVLRVTAYSKSKGLCYAGFRLVGSAYGAGEYKGD